MTRPTDRDAVRRGVAEAISFAAIVAIACLCVIVVGWPLVSLHRLADAADDSLRMQQSIGCLVLRLADEVHRLGPPDPPRTDDAHPALWSERDIDDVLSAGGSIIVYREQGRCGVTVAVDGRAYDATDVQESVAVARAVAEWRQAVTR